MVIGECAARKANVSLRWAIFYEMERVHERNMVILASEAEDFWISFLDMEEVFVFLEVNEWVNVSIEGVDHHNGEILNVHENFFSWAVTWICAVAVVENDEMDGDSRDGVVVVVNHNEDENKEGLTVVWVVAMGPDENDLKTC
jgi:hypothetical protein